MSRRRKKIERIYPGAGESSEEKTIENPMREERETKKVLFYSVIVAAVFFGFGFFMNPAITGYHTVGPETVDQLIFISPPGCNNCDEMEPIAKEVADTLGVSFMKTGFGQQIETPGFVLIYDGVLTISGMQDEYSFKNQVCVLTKNEEICNEARNLKPPEQGQPPAPEVPKSDRPEAHAFVMSHCPYGLQFLKAYIPVIELLGDKADLEVNFVHYIMHGEKEMKDNTRMYCVQKTQKEKFADYLRCFVESGDHEKCVSDVALDKNAIDTCIQETDDEFGITKTFQESQERFPPYPVDANLAQQYGVRGSPTFVINGQQVRVTRSAEAIKQAICNAFNSPPGECSQTLSSTPESPGFGPVGSGGGSSSGAQCG